MAAEDEKRARFPQTNKEYFRLVLVKGLVLSVTVFLLIFIFGKLFLPNARWHADVIARMGAISLLAGFNLTLLRLRWLKGRDK
ncbi:MAG TPA: hypothetical protein VF723_17235 [Pyrinomonadaceae bacterium]|jgi:hypothetical protein